MDQNSEPMSNRSFIIKMLSTADPITRYQTKMLADYAQKGDYEAVSELCTAHLRYIFSSVKGYAGKGFPLEDFFNEAVCGLIKSINSFNPQKGSFITHAEWWIKKSIWSMYTKEMTYRDFINKELLAFNEDLEADTKHPYLNTDTGKLALDYTLFKYDFDKALSKYTDEERSYLAHYFGFNGLEPLSMTKIASQFKVSYSHVQRTLSALLDKISQDKAIKEIWEDYQAA